MKRKIQKNQRYSQPKLNQQKSISTVISTVLFGSAVLWTSSSHADVMLGASLPNDGFSRQVITDFNNVAPKNLAYVNVYSAFSHDWDNLYWQSSNIVAEGATPMITWMPIDLARQDDNLLPEIMLGYWDEYLTQWGTKLIAWVNQYPEGEKPRLAIRFGHEFNGNWYPYSNTPDSYKSAWQSIHDLFEDMGVNEHVDWVWSASKTNVDDYNDFTVYYPGDNYVDWTALDGYNWGSNYTSLGWTSFRELFDDAYHVMVENYPTKPIMISETASAEPHDLPNQSYGMYGDDSDAFESKSVWIENMLRDLETEFPAVRALSVFNINKELSWSMSTDMNTGFDAWIAGTLTDYYTSDLLVASTINQSAPVPSAPAKGKGNGKGKDRKNKKQRIASADLAYMSTNTYTVNRTINAELQSQRAGAKKQTFKERKGNGKLAKALKNMPEKQKRKFKKMKLSVLDY